MVRPASLFIPETQVSHDKMLLLLSRFSRVRLCATNPIDGSPPGCPVPGLLQARTLEWVAISFSCYNLGDHKELDTTEHARTHKHTQPLPIDDMLRPFCLHPLKKTSQTSFWFTMVSVVPIKHIDAACSLGQETVPRGTR